MSSGAQPDIFQGRGGQFEELGHFDIHFVKNTRKKQGNILEFFLLDTLETIFSNYFFNGKLNPKMDIIKIFLFKIRILF